MRRGTNIHELLAQGDGYRRQSLYLVAMDRYSQATKLLPLSLAALCGIAACYRGLWLETGLESHFESAVLAYETIVIAFPDSRYAWVFRGDFYMVSREWQLAADDFTSALGLPGELTREEEATQANFNVMRMTDAQLLHVRSLALRETGRFEDSEQDRLRAEELGYFNEEFS